MLFPFIPKGPFLFLSYEILLCDDVRSIPNIPIDGRFANRPYTI